MGKLLFRNFVLVSIIILNIASLASGLSLTASTGGNDGCSSTSVTYGASVGDYANEHIQLNPNDGVLSNAISGSGSLPYNFISKSDSKGNYATAYRSVSGKSGVTKYTSDWSTYIPSGGSGVGVWMSLTASNAYYITAGSSSYNSEGDKAQLDTIVGKPGSQTTSQLSNYYTKAYAIANQASATQSASYLKSDSPIKMWGSSINFEKDSSYADIVISQGTINLPSMVASAIKSNVYVEPTASYIITSTGTGTLDASSSNALGDSSWFKLEVAGGKGYTGTYTGYIANVKYWGQSGRLSGTPIAESKLASLATAYGLTSTITAHAEDHATAMEKTSPTANAYYNYRGSADFIAKKWSGKPFTKPTVYASARGSDVTSTVDITSTGFKNTALLLQPFAWSFGDIFGSVPSVAESLYDSDYAVTNYNNAGVTWNKVYLLPQYTVSLINTHGWASENKYDHIDSSLGLAISDIGDPKGRYQTWEKLYPYLTAYKNDLIILDGCGTFYKNSPDINNPKGLSGFDVVKNARVRAGWVDTVSEGYANSYMIALFDDMFYGATIGKAVYDAAGGNTNALSLKGDTTWKLSGALR
jgi:hypothetical protein